MRFVSLFRSVVILKEAEDLQKQVKESLVLTKQGILQVFLAMIYEVIFGVNLIRP